MQSGAMQRRKISVNSKQYLKQIQTHAKRATTCIRLLLPLILMFNDFKHLCDNLEFSLITSR